MYKGIGDASYNDGLFSQAAPYQAYQASVSQFGDGGLGATSRLVSSRAFRSRHRQSSGSPRVHAAAGFGNVYNSGVLGIVTRDGIAELPSQSTPADQITPAMRSDLIQLNTFSEAGLTALTQKVAIGGAVLALAVGYLYFKR